MEEDEITLTNIKKRGLDCYKEDLGKAYQCSVQKITEGFEVPVDKSDKFIIESLKSNKFLPLITIKKVAYQSGVSQGMSFDPTKLFCKRTTQNVVPKNDMIIRKKLGEYKLTEVRWNISFTYSEIDGYAALGRDYPANEISKGLQYNFANGFEWMGFNGTETDESNTDVTGKKVTKGWVQRVIDDKDTNKNYWNSIEKITGDKKKLTVGSEPRVVGLEKVEQTNSKTTFTTYHPHGLDGLMVTIKGTKNYDGSHLVTKGSNGKTFTIDKSYTAETLTNAKVIKNPYWKTTDALIIDMTKHIPSHKRSDLYVIMHSDLLLDRQRDMLNIGLPTEQLAFFKGIEGRIAGRPVICPDHIPKGMIILTNPKNFCIYRHVNMRAKVIDDIEASEVRNIRTMKIDYRILDPEALFMVENVVTF